jgi:hypothetical protein
MKTKLALVISVAAAACLMGSAANASIFFNFPGPTGELATPGSAIGSFLASAGPASLNFRIDGYASLDGQGDCCEDDFTFKLNGVAHFSGSWDMGGGGNNVIFYGPPGSSANPHSNGFFAGGYTDVFVPLNLSNGVNTIEFIYSGASQGLGDEGWGLERILVTGGVPEPATWALMLSGFGLAGVALRRRRTMVAA